MAARGTNSNIFEFVPGKKSDGGLLAHPFQTDKAENSYALRENSLSMFTKELQSLNGFPLQVVQLFRGKYSTSNPIGLYTALKQILLSQYTKQTPQSLSFTPLPENWELQGPAVSWELVPPASHPPVIHSVSIRMFLYPKLAMLMPMCHISPPVAPELTMVNVRQDAQVPNIGRVSLQGSDLVQAAVSHGEHLKETGSSERNTTESS